MSATVQALRQATGQAVKALHLEHFKRVTVKFDPFHSNATPIRDFLYYVSSTQVRQTNPECALKAEVVCDRSEPTVELLHLGGGRSVVRGAHLTGLEVLQAVVRLAGARHGPAE
ncbi:mitochondrial ribosomal protein L53 isoform X1 [Haemaphysalis longicornis]